MKKILCFVLILCIGVSFFSCTGGNGDTGGTESSCSISEVSEASEEIKETEIDKSSAYICTSDDENCVQLVFSDPIYAEGDGAVIYSPSTKGIAFGENEYAIQLKRGLKGVFTVEKTDVPKTDSRNFTVLFRNENDIKLAKKFFASGREVKIVNSDKIHRFGNKMTAVIGGTPYTITDKNTDTAEADGVYLFDNRREYSAIPSSGKDQVSVVVMRDLVAYVGEVNERMFFPSVNGYVLSFVGEYAKNVKASFGDDVEILLFEPLTSPSAYVEINGYREEVNYFNCTRTAYAGAVVYDGDFQYGSTHTNEWGLEIAVDEDGKVLSVTEGGNKNSGNTPIPENGYVLSVGMDESLYSKLCKTYEGADAKLVKNVTPYTVHKMKLDGRNKPREGETAVVYDTSYGSKTPVVPKGQLELICDGDGYVIAEGDPNGGNEIPDGGFVIAFYGMRYDEIRDFYKTGSRFFVSDSAVFLYIFNYPRLLIKENYSLIEKYKAEYAECKEKLKNIDYDFAESSFEKLDELTEKLENGKVEEAAEAFVKMESVLSLLEYSFVESLRVQDRCGWAVATPKTEEEVEKICANAEKLGLNTLIVSAFNGTYATYNSKLDGVIKGSDYGDTDILASFVEKGHDHGLKVFVMFCCFTAGNTLEGLPEEHYVNQFLKKGKLLLSRSGTNENRYYDDVTYTLDMYDDEVREFFASVIAEVVSGYDIDGVQLDYIRFPLPNRYGDYPDDFGYNENTVDSFASETGISVDPHSIGMKSEYWDEWCAFRRNIITSFVVSLGERIKGIKPGLNYSVTCFADYGDRQNYVFQDPEYLMANGYVDGVYTMIYADNYESEYSYAKDIFDRMENRGTLVAGIGTYVKAGKDDINRQIVISDDIGCSGVSVFGVSYTFSGGYLDVFRKGAFREKAVRTDCGSVTVVSFADDMINRIENVYKRFYPQTDFSSLLSSVENIRKDASANTDALSASYAEKTVSELEKLKKTVSFDENKLNEDIIKHIDYIIYCLTK